MAFGSRDEHAVTSRCPSCGFVCNRTQSTCTVTLDSEGADLRALALNPREGACPNCGRAFERYQTVSYAEESFSLRLDPGVEAAAFTSRFIEHVRERCSEILASIHPIPRLVTALWERRDELSVGDRIVGALSAMNDSAQSAEWPSRHDLALLAIQQEPSHPVDELIRVAAVNAAVQSMTSGDDIVTRLDESVPLWALDSDGWQELAPEEDFDIGNLWILTLDLVAAWAADRRGGVLPAAQRERFSQLATSWVRSAPDRSMGLGNQPFLQRAIDAGAVETFILGTWADSPEDASRLAKVWTEWGVVEDTEFARRLQALVGQGEATRRPDAAVSVSPTELLRVLVAEGQTDDLLATYRSLVPGLPLADAAAAATIVIETFEQGRDFFTASTLLAEFEAEYPAETWAQLPPRARVEFVNVAGNVRKGSRGPAAALDTYASVLPILQSPELTPAHRWLVLSNAADCMLNTGQVRLAMGLVSPILGDQSYSQWERARSFAFAGRCLLELGSYEDALSLLQHAWELMRGEGGASTGRTRVLVDLSRCAQALVRAELMLDYALQAIESARQNSQAEAQLWATSAAAAAAQAAGDDRLPSLAEDTERLAQQFDERAGALLDGGNRLDASRLMEAAFSARMNLIAIQKDTASYARAIAILSEPDATQWTTLGELLLDDGELDDAALALEKAWTAELQKTLSDPYIDVREAGAFRAARRLRNTTARHALAEFRTRPSARGVLLRAAELDGSLMGSYLAWPEADRPSAAEIMNPARLVDRSDFGATALLFALYERSIVHLVISRNGRETILGEMSADELENVRGEVAAVTSRGRANGDPLARCPRWTRFSEQLGTAIEPLLAGVEQLVFLIGTAFDGLPMHEVPVPATSTGDGVIADRVDCSYVASLLQLAALRARDANTIGQAGCIVSVSRATESAHTREAFSSGAKAWSTLLSEAMKTTVLDDAVATAESISRQLQTADLALFSCHGVSDSRTRTHAFLVAGNGQQPPSLVQSFAPGPVASAFLLNWEDLPARCPQVVLSAACSSASSTIAVGGERLSLDRVLFANGTRVFVGPLWDVSVEEAHVFVAAFLRCLLGLDRDGGPRWTSASTAFREARATVAHTVSAATRNAFVLLGDWR